MRVARVAASGILILAGFLPLARPLSAQESTAAPLPSTTIESRFAAVLAPAGELDHVVAIVELAPGAGTNVHSHPGPEFATVLAGRIVQHSVSLDTDTVQSIGSMWVETADDPHYGREVAERSARVFATYIIPRDADLSTELEGQPGERRPIITLSALVRVPIKTESPQFAVMQSVTTYAPGASITSSVDPDVQCVLLVLEGQVEVGVPGDMRTFGPGDSWIETSDPPVMSTNATSQPASVVSSRVIPRP